MKNSSGQTKIFIASSIVEFERERDLIENYFWRKNTGEVIAIQPLRCENFDPAMCETRKEDDFCGQIAESDVCLFIIGKKVGGYTVEEYDCARRLVGEGKNLRIIAFYKDDTSPFYNRLVEDGTERYGFCDDAELIALLDKHFNLPPAYTDVSSAVISSLGAVGEASAQEGPVYIFLASSIKDDEVQRLRIENFIWRMNSEFTHKYGVAVRPLFGGVQSGVFGELISKSAMCFFIVFGNVDDEVMDELKFAKKRFDENKFPRIYVYFKSVDGDETQSVTGFKKYLDGELNHFYGLFKDIDTIKLRILLNLAILKDGSREVTFKDGKCIFGENLKLDVKNVSEFVNNKKLGELKTSLKEAATRFRTLKIDYERNPSDEEICKEYYLAASKYDSLKRSIESQEDSIFSVSLALSLDEANGFSERQRLAYKYFMEGDDEKAVATLDMEESMDEYNRQAKRAAQANELARQAAKILIAEGRQKISFLKTMHKYASRDNEIRKTYQNMIIAAREQRVELGVFNEYALFLRSCQLHSEALEQAQELQKFYKLNEWENAIDVAENLTTLAVIYTDLSDYQKHTKSCSLAAIKIRERALKQNGYDEANHIGLARTCVALGNLYRRSNTPDSAEKYFSRAEKLFAELEENTDKYVTEQAETFIKRGINFAEQYLLEKAFAKFGMAIDIWQRHRTDDPQAQYVKSSAYQNQASQLKKEGRYVDAIEKFDKALKIREELTALNPTKYTSALAHSYQGLGNVYRALREWDKALDNFYKALKIRIGICAVNAKAHEVELSDSYIKICGTLLDNGCADEAFVYLEKGYEIRRRLYAASPKTYERWYAQSLFELGRYNQQKGDMQTAEKYYDDAFAIRVKISSENLQPNIEGLHDSFTKMKQLYGEGFKSRLTEAEAALYEKLYSFEAVDADTGERLKFENSFTGI